MQTVNRHAAALIRAGFPAWDVDRLMAISRSLSRIAERQCSEEMDDATTARLEAREARLEAEADRIARSRRGWRVYIQGDPRGCAVYLYRMRDLRRQCAGIIERETTTGSTRRRAERIAVSCAYSSIGIPAC